MIEFERGGPVVVDRSLHQELGKGAVKRTVEQLRVKAAAFAAHRLAAHSVVIGLVASLLPDRAIVSNHGPTHRRLTRKTRGFCPRIRAKEVFRCRARDARGDIRAEYVS
jgi:hypothetical protein